IITQKNVS
ncbi:putative membrane protein, partial [Escherichia coli 3.4870]